jgi:hypothetical protein
VLEGDWDGSVSGGLGGLWFWGTSVMLEDEYDVGG